MIKIADFRNNIRRYLELAKNGPDEVILERFGEQWKLTWLGGSENPKIEIEKVARESSKPKIIKTPKEAASAVAQARDRGDSCKIHGTPLDDRGRCLQKGCKWA